MTRPTFAIALDLLEAERERLLGDHYETAPNTAALEELRRYAPCDGCERAYAVRQEIDALRRLSRVKIDAAQA